MIVLLYIGIVLAAIIAAFLLELFIVALYPGVSVQKQHLKRRVEGPQHRETSEFSTKKDVSFIVEGTSISAWLYLPQDVAAPIPCIVMAHGLGGTKNLGLDSYAVRFQEAGLAVLAFDYRHLGESEGQPRQLIWIPYQLQDYAAAVEYVRGRKEIDPARVALWGTSLSGGHVMVTAASDHRIACVSAQVPLLDGSTGPDDLLHRLGIRHMFRMAGHAQRDLVRSWLGLSPHKIPLVGKPGTIALMADMDAWRTFEELASADFVNEACARIGVRMDKYRPINHASKICCPVLLQVCDYDFTLPSSVVEKASKRLGQLAEIIRYPLGHFDIYVGDSFEKAVNEQLAFFKKHLVKAPRT